MKKIKEQTKTMKNKGLFTEMSKSEALSALESVLNSSSIYKPTRKVETKLIKDMSQREAELTIEWFLSSESVTHPSLLSLIPLKH